MNKIYGLKWRADVGAFVVVPETARTVSVKRSPRDGSPLAAALAVTLAGLHQMLNGLKPLWAAMVTAGLSQAYAAPPLPAQLPTGGKVSAGAASISQAGNVMTVTQGSQRAAVNWQSFDVGSQGTVNFVQPSSSSVILNRVLGGAPSQIFGQINSNGQVILSNPSGILFSPSATLNVGALTATTHSLSDSNLMAGKLAFERNGSQASVVNEGQITTALGGYVALLAPEVRNSGVILAQMGTVALASGEWIELQFDERSKLANLMVTPSAVQALVDNRQAVQAPGGLIILSAQAASRLQGGVVRNSGTLEAKGIVNDGGVIRITASDRIVHSGRISADAKADATGQGGTVTLIADLNNSNSVTEVSGSISAQGGAAGGRGGFVDTSASRLAIAEGALVNTSAPQGEAGTWLLDPYNVTIAASGASGTTYNNNFTAGSDSVIQASSIISALNLGSNVTIDTGAAGSPGASAGNITVSAAITRTSGGTPKLTLNAANQIDISANMGSNGVGLDLVLNAGGGAGVFSGVFAGTGSLTKQGAGTVILAGNNPYTGATNISGGTLQIGNGGASGSVTGNITNNAALAFNRSNALTYAGVISGSGTVAQIGAGATTLSGNNSYSGTTTVSAGQLTLSGANTGTGAITVTSGTLQVGNGTTSGSLSAVSITNNAALVFSRSDALSYSGAISGTGSLSSSGGGTVTLSGTNSYSGTTTVSGGTLVLSGSNTGVGMVTVNTTRQLKIGDGGASGSVAADITNNGTVVFNRTDALTYSGAISGTGAMTQSGTGTTKLTGSNTYTGGTTISAGTLQIGDAGTSGSLTGRIVNNAALVFNRSDVTYTYGGVISGAGTVSQSGTGMVTLTGENTGTGTITIQNGTLQIGNGGTTGSVAASITNNASLFFNRSNTVTYSGVISGSGTLRQYGSGTLALSGNNTYTGVTTIYFGKLLVGNGSTNGSLTGDIVNRAALEFSRSDAHSYGGIISGAGSLTQSGAGALTLSGNNSYSGTSLVSNGTLILSGSNTGVGVITVNSRTQLSIGNGGASGSVAADITNGGTVVFNRTDAVTYSGAISGTGVLAQSGSGTTKLTGSNTFSGTTTISGGTLQIGDAGASGSLTSNITNNAALVFNRSDVTYTYGGVISGSGTLTQSGAGTVTLSGANLYTGSTAVSAGQLTLTGANAGTGAITISSGTLQVGAGDTTGSISATSITNNGALVFNRSDALLSYAGIISGSGSLTKSGTGTVTLSGRNSYSGATTVSGGTLNLSGSNSGSGTITVNTGTLLKVSGTSGSVAANITVNGGVEFSRSTDWTYASAISGSGTLTHSGAGTTTLSGNNSYAGTTTVGAGQLTLTGDNTGSGAFTISGGTLQVGAGGTSGSLSATSITTNAANTALVFSRSNAYTYAGIISGAGSLTKSGTGTVTLSANNTYSGATTVSAGQLTLTGNNSGTGDVTISAGTLQVGTGGTIGSISAASVTNNGALVFSRSDALYTYDGSIIGTGSVTKSGAGTVTLSRNNSYSGGTTINAGQLILAAQNTGAGAITINAGTLQVGSGGTSGSISAASITNNGALVFNRSTLLTYAGVISGTGTVAQTGEGATTLSGNNSYSGTTTVSAGQLTLSGTNSGTGTITISGGTLWVGDGNTSGSISAASITNNAALVFSRSDALLTYSGAISGSGSLSNLGNGTLTLSGNNSYAGTTLVSNGTLVLSGSNTGAGVITVNFGTQLKIGDGGASGSVAADITNGGTVVFNRTGAVTYSGAMSGTGVLTQSGSGTTKLTGSNTYSGTTTISGGTLQMGDAGTSGSLTSNITNNAALVFNRSDALTYAGIISGTGSLSQSGAGNTTLSGANLYTGSTAVSAGQLTLTGANAGTGAITISGGTLQVGTGDTTGSISAASITNNGTLVFNRADEILLGLSYSGIISGTGSLTKSGTGTVTLSGSNSYSGATTVSGGTLNLSGSNSGMGTITVNTGSRLKVSGASGSVAANITGNGAVEFSRSTDWTYGGIISGTGTLTHSGSGTTTLSSNNSYTGTTTVSAGQLTLSGNNTGSGAFTISGGRLQVGTGGTSGSLSAISITNNGGLVFSRSDAHTYVGIISGAGSLTKSGTGTVTLSANNTYSGATTVSAGQLTLTGNNSGTGDVTISAGTLQLGNGGASGEVAGDITNNGSLVFSRSDALLIYAGSISGTGSVTKSGTGTVTLSRNNSYSGGTTISAGQLILTAENTGAGAITLSGGTLQVGTGGTSGSISAASITNNGALVFNRSTLLTYAGVISGTGTVAQTGEGATTLSGNNSYSGTTTVSAGQLTLSGTNSGTGTITISGGTLWVGDGNTSGSISAASITNNAALVFSRSDALLTYSGAISGTGSLSNRGNGTLTLSGNNSYAGTTLVSNGTLVLSGSNTGAGVITVNFGTQLKIGDGGASGSVAADITNGGTVVFNRTGAVTYSGAMSGTGVLTQSGSGTTKLTGSNTYSGTTTISGGTLQMGDAGTSGSLTSNIINNSALAFNRSDALIYGGVISGSGSVAQSGAGNTTLSGNNSYRGTTTVSAGQLILTGANAGTGSITISGGTLQVGTGDTTGSISAASITNNGALVLNRSGEGLLGLSYAGIISGTGSLTSSGTGTVTLSADNTYSGATTVSGGTLDLSGSNSGLGTITVNSGALLKVSGTSGSVAANITDNGAVVFSRSTAWTFGGAISGAGTLTQSGAGTTSLAGANTLTGGTTIIAGTLQVGSGGSSGSLAGNVLNSATLAFNRVDTAIFGGVISGAGQLTQVGLGTTKLIGDNTYTGRTTISAGTLQVGDGGTSGSIIGNVINNSSLVFNRSAASLAYTFSGVISGSGIVTQSGAGTTVLTGDNTYTGGTTISAGTVQLGNAGATGSVLGDISNKAALVFNHSAPNKVILSGAISGSGSVTQSGAGTIILTGDNTYTGLTTISGGTLQLGSDTASGAGSIAGSIAGNIANSGALVIKRSNDWTYSGVISGAGTVTQNGTGTITLTGDNTGTGSMTVTQGKLKIGNAGTTGVLVGNIALNNSGVLVFNRSNDWTYSGTISGTGHVEQNGSGATTLASDNTRVGLTDVNAGQLILAGNNDSAGRFTVKGGTLKIGAGAAAGSLRAPIINDSEVVFNRSDTYIYGGVISGSGRLVQGGTGTTKLTGTSTYTGGTTISAGTLQIGDGGTSGIIIGNVTNNAALVFNRSDTLTVFSGVISGTGSVTQSGTGITTLAGANTYTGGTTISAGTLQLGDDGAKSPVNDGATGSVLGDITNNAALVFSRSDTLTYGGVISGSGTLAQSGTGTTILTGANTYSGGTSITKGTLQIGDGGVTGAVAGNISVGSNISVSSDVKLVFNRSDALSFAGVISGNGRLVLNGAATITLTGKNTFIGSTAVNSGTLLIAGTSNLGTPSAGVYTYIGNIDIGGGATFNYGSLTTDTQKFTGLITGGGRFVKSGTSILEVNSNVGQMGHGGGTTVDSGTLQLNGGFAGNLTNNARLVLNGGTLSGVVSGAGTVVFGGRSSILDNAQTYTGGTTIAGGNTITLKAGGAFPAFTDLTIEEGGTLVVKANATFRSLAGGGVINYPGVIGETVTLTVGGGMASTDISTFSGNIGKNGTNGTFIFKKDGPGTQILNGNFILGDAIHILQGTLQVGNGGTSGTIPALKNAPVGGEDTATTDNTNCGKMISCVIVNNGVLAINRSDDVDFSGAMSGTGGLLKAGAGNLNLKSAAWARPVSLNSFTGGTTITGGTLTIAATGALGVGGPLTITGGTLATTRYDWFNDWTGQSQGPRNYDVDASTVTITGGLITGSGAVRASGGFAITTNTDMTIVGNLSGAGGLTKAGTGTLTLSGFNSYSGNTLVSAGILKAANLAFGQGTVTVSDGAAVDINGYSLENNYVLSGTGVASSGALFNSSTGKAMLYGGLVLRSDTLIKTNGDLTIDNSVESVAAGYYGLSIVNTGKVEITRNIGRPGERWQDTTRLGYLEVSGNVAIGGNIKTDGPLSFNGQVELYADNLTLSSEYGGVRAAQGFRSALQETRIVQFTGGNQYIYNGTTYTIGAVGAPLTGSLFASPVAGNYDSDSNTWAPGYTAYSWVAPTTTTAQLLVVAGGGSGGWHSDIKDIGGGGAAASALFLSSV